ncbi:MAG: Arylsulfatase [Verrucomicrobia subdivision 3 bacterium]|nr:Arylsulfatase [Limisphaerales bacterium]MCS1415665.1 Arylsulfatase [Limisphaerales bacterium]
MWIAVLMTSAFFSVGAAERPNIVFFLSDDHRSDFLGCAGHAIVRTPRLDELAGQGARFNNAFVTTSICAASRASIFTGLVERSHRYTFGTPPIAAEFTQNSCPQLLRASGYYTGFVGKFGVSVESGAKESMFDSFVPLHRNPYFKKKADGALRHLTEIAGDHAIEFIRQRDETKPFCLSVSFNAAHAEDSDRENHYPWPQAEDGLYENLTIPPPRLSSPSDYETQPEFLKASLNRVRYFWRWDTDEKYQKNVKAYYRMITGLDRVIGRILDELKSQGLSENTVVIFTGDNGYYKGSRGFAGKWSHYEESLRVPLIIYDPRLPQAQRGRVIERMALNIDLPATMLEFAEVGVPESYQGKSLAGLVAGEPVADWRTDFFCEHLFDHAQIPKWEGVRQQRWVYARYFQQKPVFEFLHDLSADPLQRQNLAFEPQHAQTLQNLRQRCDQLRDEYGGAYSLEKIPTVKYLRSKLQSTN